MTSSQARKYIQVKKCHLTELKYIRGITQVRREGGLTGALVPPPPAPTGARGPLFLLISDLKQSEVGVLFYSNI